MEIAPGIYVIDGRGVNIYLVSTAEDCILIDAGTPGREEQVFALLGKLGRPVTDLSHVLITHADLDHVGSLAAIVARSGARVVAGAPTAAHIAAGTFPKHMPAPIQFVMERFMRYAAVSASQIDHCAPGDTLPFLGGMSVIATPGHTADHLSFFSAQAGVLFAGDALETRKELAASRKMIAWDYAAVVRSAINLLEYNPATIACGHGAPSNTHTADDLMMLFNHLRQS
jgi:glyoxylase-like metal-dependent hydrolase (beta-lactamase superfamily II)